MLDKIDNILIAQKRSAIWNHASRIIVNCSSIQFVSSCSLSNNLPFFIEISNRVMKRTPCPDTTIFIRRIEAYRKSGMKSVWKKEKIVKQLPLLIEVRISFLHQSVNCTFPLQLRMYPTEPHALTTCPRCKPLRKLMMLSP